MSETISGPSSAAPDGRRADPSLSELIDGAMRKVVTSIVIAGGIVALAIYAQPGPPRYQISAAEGRIYRLDTRSGTVIACENDRCASALKHGHRLERSLSIPFSPKHEAPPAPALPAPRPDGAAAPAPAAPPGQ